MPKKPRLKVGFFDLTGCNGCLLSVIFNESELLDLTGQIDISAFRFIAGTTAKKYDMVFVEGLVADNKDLDNLKKIRESTTYLVALGTCAITGNLPALRNWMSPNKYGNMVYDRKKELKDTQPVPISKFVKVDFSIPGCPPDNKQILDFVKDVVLGKVHPDYDKPVCFECRLNENRCVLIHDGKPCLGPITKGGCNSICTNAGWECWGCRGLTPDANIEVMQKLLQEHGHKKAFVEKRMKAFVAVDYDDIPKVALPKPLPIKKIKIKKEPVNKETKPKTEKPAKKKAVKKKAVKKKVVKKKTKKKVKKKASKKKAVKKKMVKKKRPAKKKKAKKKAGKKKKPAKKKVVKKKPKKNAVKKTKKKTVKKKDVKRKPTKEKKAKKRTLKKTVKKTLKKTAKKNIMKKNLKTSKKVKTPAKKKKTKKKSVQNNSKKKKVKKTLKNTTGKKTAKKKVMKKAKPKRSSRSKGKPEPKEKPKVKPKTKSLFSKFKKKLKRK